MFLEECKYVGKEKKISTCITDDINISSIDSDRENSYHSDKKNSNE